MLLPQMALMLSNFLLYTNFKISMHLLKKRLMNLSEAIFMGERFISRLQLWAFYRFCKCSFIFHYLFFIILNEIIRCSHSPSVVGFYKHFMDLIFIFYKYIKFTYKSSVLYSICTHLLRFIKTTVWMVQSTTVQCVSNFWGLLLHLKEMKESVE